MVADDTTQAERDRWGLESSVKAEEVLLSAEEVTESRVRSPARLMVVKVKVPLVSADVWEEEDEEVSSPRRVVSGLSWGGVTFWLDIQELASQETGEEESDVWPVL